MHNKFLMAEMSGRTLFEQALKNSGITEYTFTTNPYDRVDVFFTAGTTPYAGEIKFRSYPSTKEFFTTEGVVLEKHKYDDMKTIQHLSGYTPLYIHIFSDGVVALFDLSSGNPTWIEEVNKYERTTMGDRTKIRKAVAYLPLPNASNVAKIPL